MYRNLFLYISIISLGCFIWMSFNYDSVFVSRIDDWLIRHIQQLESDYWTGVMKVITYIGSKSIVIFIILVIIICFLLFKQYWKIGILIVAVLGSVALNHLLKLLITRVRPDTHPLIIETGYSFPSGHSMNAFTLYGMMTVLLWTYVPNRIGRSLLVGFSLFMIVAIGLSRIYLGVHYPSDVIAAYLASCTWVSFVIFVASLKQSLNE
jgi:undecaprenyl-diphosphatase